MTGGFDDTSTSAGTRVFVPIWGDEASGTANIVDRDIWQNTGRNGYGGPVVMALIAAGELPESATPRDARGKTWSCGLEHLRDLGYEIPDYSR